MLNISTGKVVRIIFLAREYGPESGHLHDYISGLNEDEQANLVALMWVGRDSFDAAEFEEAKAATEGLCKLIKEVLDDKVDKVVVSSRLADSPCVLVTGEFGWAGCDAMSFMKGPPNHMDI